MKYEKWYPTEACIFLVKEMGTKNFPVTLALAEVGAMKWGWKIACPACHMESNRTFKYQDLAANAALAVARFFILGELSALKIGASLAEKGNRK